MRRIKSIQVYCLNGLLLLFFLNMQTVHNLRKFTISNDALYSSFEDKSIITSEVDAPMVFVLENEEKKFFDLLVDQDNPRELLEQISKNEDYDFESLESFILKLLAKLEKHRVIFFNESE